jgi:hypothetical protein
MMGLRPRQSKENLLKPKGYAWHTFQDRQEIADAHAAKEIPPKLQCDGHPAPRSPRRKLPTGPGRIVEGVAANDERPTTGTLRDACDSRQTNTLVDGLTPDTQVSIAAYSGPHRRQYRRVMGLAP